MGFSSPVDDQYKNLRRVRNKLLLNIEIKKIELEKSEEEIKKMSKQITQEQDEIKQFSHTLTKDELQIRAKKLISLEKDKEREKQNYDRLDKYNDLLKTNLSSVENKMNELELHKNLKDTNEVLTNLIDTSQTIADNAQKIMTSIENGNQIIEGLTITSGAITGDNRTPDDLLKELLGDTKNGENGGVY